MTGSNASKQTKLIFMGIIYIFLGFIFILFLRYIYLKNTESIREENRALKTTLELKNIEKKKLDETIEKLRKMIDKK